MTKSRRKSDIRDVMEQSNAALLNTMHERPVRRKRVPKWQSAFLAALAKGTTARDAARIAGIGFSNIYVFRSQNAEFAMGWDQAIATFERSKYWFKRPVANPFCTCKVHKPSTVQTVKKAAPNPTTVQRLKPTVQR